jgi:hypothetical protein
LRRVLTLLMLCAVASCELREIVTAGSEDVVIAEVYLRTDSTGQIAWLHRTRTDGGITREVPNARIEVTNATTGRVIAYQAAPDSMCVVASRDARGQELGSCYVSPATASPVVIPGQRYNLRITLPDGGEMTGTTVVPGDFRVLRPATQICTLPPATRLELMWSASAGAWVYPAETNIFGLRRILQQQGIEIEDDPLNLFGLSVSSADTTMVFPAEFGLFDRFDDDLLEALVALQQGLPAETRAEVIIGAADRNYVNWERGGTFNPSGLVRIASIRGSGTGTFGSIVLKRFEIHVTTGNLPGVPAC